MSFEQLVMRCAAPALCGIKTASLFAVSLEVFKDSAKKIAMLNKAFLPYGVHTKLVRSEKNRRMFLVYNRQQLASKCAMPECRLYLMQKGYDVDSGIDCVIGQLSKKLSGFSEGDFPHEVGFFLGYPLEDVIAFERYSGERFKYSGYWKVYGNVDSARNQMKLYRQCSSYCESLLSQGMSISGAAKKYKTFYGR